MDSSSPYSRRRDLLGAGDDLEEGEYVPGRDDSYRFHVAPLPPERPLSRTPSSCESDETISDDDDPGPAGSSVLTAGAAAPAARRFVCHVCGTGFRSSKAVDGHMRVHGNGNHVAAVAGGWAATGKRGWIGGKPLVVSMAMVSRDSESTDDHSTAIVSVRPLEPIPLAAIAMTNLSTRTNLFGDESSSSASAEPMNHEPMATVVSGSSDPSITGAVVHQQVTPPPPADQQAHPSHQLPSTQPQATHQAQSMSIQHPLAPPPPAQQPRREYSCKLCGKSYATHQGLGGHAAGHRNRQKEAEAAAAAAGMAMLGGDADAGAFLAALRRGGRKEEAPHECQKCHKVFATGVALGGHMRMHYTGPPIIHKKSKKRCLALPVLAAVSGGDLRLGLSSIKEEPSPPAPAVGAGRVRLFGIDIGPQVQEPVEEQGSGMDLAWRRARRLPASGSRGA